MPTFQSPRGTQDILPDRQSMWRHIRNAAERTAERLGYQPITLPTYEELGLFQRSIGSGTDIIDKELFIVRHKNASDEGEQYALRPEGTAGMVRAFIEHGMHTWPQPVRLFSIVNNFRYDRPQKGRYREHNQFDIEYYGDKGPFADAWVIFTTWQFLRELGLDTSVLLQLNSLGTTEDRERYIETLRKHLEPYAATLSSDSQARLKLNPLRILDSKDPADQELVDAAPRLEEFLSPESAAHAEAVKAYLTNWDIPWTTNHRLVRGLDYYSHTAFEWTIADNEGQQSSLGGGGRYDGLLTQLGGPDVGGVGAGMGLERLMLEMERKNIAVPMKTERRYSVITLDEEGRALASQTTKALADAGCTVTANLSKTGIGSQIKSAVRLGMTHAVIIGGNEAATNTLQIKNLEDGTQESVSVSDFTSSLHEPKI